MENFEPKKEFGLSPEKIKKFEDFWREVVLANQVEGKNKISKDEEELKKNLYGSLMKEIEEICEEWELSVENISEKSELEIAEKINEKIRPLVENFKQSSGRSNKWDSWPSLMRENRQFNCVGASLLGHHLLNQLGVENFVANPVDHAINLIKVSDDEYVYADFQNNVVKRIGGKIRRIHGFKVLEIDEAAIEYKKVIVLKNEQVPSLVIGNLINMLEDLADPKEAYSMAGADEAQEFYDRYSEIFNQANLEEMKKALYENLDKLNDDEEIEGERDRVKKIHLRFGEFRGILQNNLSQEDIIKCHKFFKKNPGELREFILLDKDFDTNELPQEVKTFVRLCKEWLEEVRKEGEKMHKEMLHMLRI